MKHNFQIGSALDVGQKRHGKANQDSIGISIPGWFNRRPPLLVLSDGMGAYGGGEVASKIAVDTLKKCYKANRTAQPDYLKILETGVHVAHQRIIKKARSKKDLEWMGCTIVAVVLTESEIHLANVGDSRAYIVNQTEIRQISFDHSFVAEQVCLGLITELEARNHPKRNVLTLSLSARRETADPYLASVPWTEGDTLLLCSDGLWGPVTEQQIQTVLLEMAPQQAADKLVKLANTNGGPDNISVIISRHSDFNMEDRQTNDDTGPGE